MKSIIKANDEKNIVKERRSEEIATMVPGTLYS